MIQIINEFLSLVRIPLSFFPESVQKYFAFVVGFFSIFYVGKLARWLWDILPVA